LSEGCGIHGEGLEREMVTVRQLGNSFLSKDKNGKIVELDKVRIYIILNKEEKCNRGK